MLEEYQAEKESAVLAPPRRMDSVIVEKILVHSDDEATPRDRFVYDFRVFLPCHSKILRCVDVSLWRETGLEIFAATFIKKHAFFRHNGDPI